MTNDLALADSTPALVESLDQPSRLLVARSPAFNLLVNAEPDDEIREAITDELRGALPPALRGVRTELLVPESMEDQGRMVVELGRYMRIAGGGWPAEQREEWISGATEELCEYPLELVVDAIGRARKRVRYPGEFVPWVVNEIEPAVDKLRIEEQRMTKLMEIAAS